MSSPAISGSITDDGMIGSSPLECEFDAQNRRSCTLDSAKNSLQKCSMSCNAAGADNQCHDSSCFGWTSMFPLQYIRQSGSVSEAGMFSTDGTDVDAYIYSPFKSIAPSIWMKGVTGVLQGTDQGGNQIYAVLPNANVSSESDYIFHFPILNRSQRMRDYSLGQAMCMWHWYCDGQGAIKNGVSLNPNEQLPVESLCKFTNNIIQMGITGCVMSQVNLSSYCGDLHANTAVPIGVSGHNFDAVSNSWPGKELGGSENISSYGGGVDGDPNKPDKGTVLVSNGVIKIKGDAWKKIRIPEVTLNEFSDLAFHFRSSVQGKIHGIGLARSNSPGVGQMGIQPEIFINLWGTDTSFGNYQFPGYYIHYAESCRRQKGNLICTKATEPSWGEYTKELGSYYNEHCANKPNRALQAQKCTFDYLIIAADDDTGLGESEFKNIRLLQVYAPDPD